MNSIRTPRQGTTATSRRIAQAVDDEGWQKFRLSMKGKTTAQKLDMLQNYYDDSLTVGTWPYVRRVTDEELEVIKIRIDNYIKALCRGGQLDPGMTFDHFSDGCIRNHIRK